MGELLFSLSAVFAQFESRQISERIKRTVLKHKKEGLRGPGRRPYGWTINKHKMLERQEREHAAIDLMSLQRDQGSTWAQVADFLNQKDYKTVGGSAWCGSGVRLVHKAALARRTVLADVCKKEESKDLETE